MYSHYMKTTFLIPLLAAIISIASGSFLGTPAFGAAHSETVSGDVFLGGDFIELGLSKWGNFGTEADPSSAFFGTAARSNIGMSNDIDGFGQGTDWRMDYFLPGTPEETWVIGYKIGGLPTTASNCVLEGRTDIPNSVVDTSSGSTLSAVSTGTYASTLEIVQTYSFEVDEKYFRNDVVLTNVSASTLTEVRYMRSFDPDNTVDQSGSYTTRNTVQKTIADDGYAVVTADNSPYDTDPVYVGTGSRAPIWFSSNHPGAVASHFGFTNTDPYEAEAYDSPPAKGVSTDDDRAITINIDVGTLAPGASASLTYYTSLDERDYLTVLDEIGFVISESDPPPTPEIINVTSTPISASYSIGSVIEITVHFSHLVWVKGTPQLVLRTGPAPETAWYSSGSGTEILTFLYTVAAGDDLSVLDYWSQWALELNDGRIYSNQDIDADLDLSVPGEEGSLGYNTTLGILGTLYPVYRFYSPGLLKHFFTIDENEKEHLIANAADVWNYEGIAYYAYFPAQYDNASRLLKDTLRPVHRFYSEALQTHLFTIDENEKEHLIANAADVWRYEDIAFYIPGAEKEGAVPVYRFYSETLLHHLFTIDENEMNHLVETAGDVWNYEGIAYYAFP